jgi:hypothetical protein
VHQDHRSLEHIDHVSHARPGIKPFPDRLYVVSVISNPEKYRSRILLAQSFMKHMEESGVKLLMVEASFGDRKHEVTEADNPWHLQLSSHDHQHLWAKENLINLGVARLSQLVPDWKYVAWIDADITFARPSWAQETLHGLAHYQILQPFRYAYHLGPDDQVLETHQSFGYCYSHGVPESREATYNEPATKGTFWHPGFAWAARRSFFQATGGLMDFSALGSGDHLCAQALIGRVREAYHTDVSEGFKRQCHLWEERAKALNRNLGAIGGSIWHAHHGSLQSRAYRSRWGYLTDGVEPGLGATVADDSAKFNPETDLIRDHQGLWQLHPSKIKLRDGMREYFRNRKEDVSL